MDDEIRENEVLNQRLDQFAEIFKASDLIEVAMNTDGTLWKESFGDQYMVQCDASLSSENLTTIGRAIGSATSSVFSAEKPLISGTINYRGRLLRAQVMAFKTVNTGAAISFRSYNRQSISVASFGLLNDQMIDVSAERKNTLDQILKHANHGDIDSALKVCADERMNIVVSGATSSGKTTFTNGLLHLIHEDERLITIEDAYELDPPQKNCVRLRSNREPTHPAAAPRLLEGTLRMRPDRIILGELRGAETKTFLDAINTGHGGSITTVHADSGKKALERLALMVMETGVNMSFADVIRYCESSIDLVVQLGRRNGKRGILELYVP